jgi:hypothetical protein
MPILLQDVIVTLVALGAVGVLIRRLVDVARPKPSAPACGSCATSKTCAPAAASAAAAPEPAAKPLVFVRHKS